MNNYKIHHLFDQRAASHHLADSAQGPDPGKHLSSHCGDAVWKITTTILAARINMLQTILTEPDSKQAPSLTVQHFSSWLIFCKWITVAGSSTRRYIKERARHQTLRGPEPQLCNIFFSWLIFCKWIIVAILYFSLSMTHYLWILYCLDCSLLFISPGSSVWTIYIALSFISLPGHLSGLSTLLSPLYLSWHVRSVRTIYKKHSRITR